MITNIDQNNRMSRIFLYMMHIAFIEIRSSESLNASKKFADIFHGLPMRLAREIDDDEGEVIYQELLERSSRYSMENYIKDLKAIAENQFNVRQN